MRTGYAAQQLHGQFIEGSISGSDYNTYILEGTQGNNDYFAQPCDPAGKTQTCECGGPIEGVCDDTDGTWHFSTTCQSKPPTSQTCSNGRQIRSVSCGTDGWSTGEWTACASEAAVKSYEEIQKYDGFFRQIREAQEAYYLNHGQYAVNLNNLNLTLPAGCQKITGGGGNYGHWIKCGSDLFIDNGAIGPSETNGFLMVEYCPGHNTGYYDCRDIRSSISYYWYDHPRESSISAADRYVISPGNEGCLVMNNSSLGKEVCGTYYEHYRL